MGARWCPTCVEAANDIVPASPSLPLSPEMAADDDEEPAGADAVPEVGADEAAAEVAPAAVDGDVGSGAMVAVEDDDMMSLFLSSADAPPRGGLATPDAGAPTVPVSPSASLPVPATVPASFPPRGGVATPDSACLTIG